MTEKHVCDEFRWEICINEEGWICIDCGERTSGEPLGYDPHRDKANCKSKVEDILFELHEANILYVSNGSDGDVKTHMVANRCRNENRYDQTSIIRFLLELEPIDTYWQRLGLEIRAGNDIRDRCDHCSKLASCWSNSKKYCSEHTALSYT